jgi:hypothetical protein
MELYKRFSALFGTNCEITLHAAERLRSRFSSSELRSIDIIIQAGIREFPIEKWNSCKVAFVDDKSYIGIVSVFEEQNQRVKIITFIRGKSPSDYVNTIAIPICLSKEVSMIESRMINLNRVSRKLQVFI